MDAADLLGEERKGEAGAHANMTAKRDMQAIGEELGQEQI